MSDQQIIIKAVFKAFAHLKWNIVCEGTILYCFQIRRYVVPETLSICVHVPLYEENWLFLLTLYCI